MKLQFIIISLLLVILVGGCIQSVSETPKLIYEFGGCDESKTTRLADTKDVKEIIVQDNMLIIKHNLNYVCCANMKIEFEQKGNIIELVEVNKGEMCRCMCTYNVDASIGPFETGSYTLKVYGVKYLDNEPELIFEKRVDIK